MKRTILATILSATFIIHSCKPADSYDASGIFEATEVTVSAESAGKILMFDCTEGDSVAQGELIAIIDTMQLYYQKEQLIFQRSASNAARPDISVQLAALRRELSKQNQERTRTENLLRSGAATTKQLDDINAAIQVIEDQIAAKESTLRNNNATIDETALATDMQIRQIEDRLDDCLVKSPLSGTVLTKYCQAGEYALPGKPLCKIADLSNIYLRAYFTANQLADIRIGRQVTVIADFGGDEQYEYPGKIIWIAEESEFTPKSIQTRDSRANLVYAVKIAITNDGRLKLGQYGEVLL